MPLLEYLSESDLAEIQQVVHEVEQSCPGEIIPVFAAQSSYYESALWRGALLFVGIYSISILFWHYLVFDLSWTLYIHFLGLLLSGILGASLAALIPSWKRYLVGPATMKGRVFDASLKMFVKHGLFNTNNRTGILIYISFFEHLGVIETDVGVSDVVPNSEWDKVMGHLVVGMREGRHKDAICNIIKECGNILIASELPWDPDKTNQLPNQPIVEI